MLKEPTITEVNGRTIESMAKDIADIREALTKDKNSFVEKVWIASFWGCIFVSLSVIAWTVIAFIFMTVTGFSLVGLFDVFT